MMQMFRGAHTFLQRHQRKEYAKKTQTHFWQMGWFPTPTDTDHCTTLLNWTIVTLTQNNLSHTFSRRLCVCRVTHFRVDSAAFAIRNLGKPSAVPVYNCIRPVSRKNYRSTDGIGSSSIGHQGFLSVIGH